MFPYKGYTDSKTCQNMLFFYVISFSLILDTQKQAENALKAAQAYENIVAAIRDAGDAALSSINATTIALDMVSWTPPFNN
jgi:hypothetical protein